MKHDSQAFARRRDLRANKLADLARLARLTAMARRWQLQEAKNRLSEVVDLACSEGPQTVTRHGKEIAVIVSKKDFDRRRQGRGRPGTLLTFLRGLPFAGARLDLARSKDGDRDLDL
jgi:antitoxin Phd